MKFNESVEDYLECIHILNQSKDGVHPVDIARHMGFSRASVTIALKKLLKRSLVSINDDGHVILTAAGEAIAIAVFEKHEILSSWLISMGVDKETALEDACRMEHVMSEESFNAVKNIIKSGTCQSKKKEHENNPGD